jgi:tetratricopeptide (TPR) repeat protein
LGWLAIDRYHYNEALKWVRKALSITSHDIETILLKGYIHLDRKDSNLAIDAFNQCINLQRDYGRALSFSGMAFYQLGRVDEAIARLEKAQRLGGDINTPHLLGCYYMAQNNHDKAEEVLREAANYPEIAFLADFSLGLLELLRGRENRAARQFRFSIEKCREILSQDKSLLVARVTLCKNYALLGKHDHCSELIDALRYYAAFDGSYAYDLAQIYAIMGEEENCAQYLKKAVDTVRGPTQHEVEIDSLLKHFMK